MTDRADEIARSICTNLTSAGALEGADPYTERMVLDALRAYGDECRNAALEEAVVGVREACEACDGAGGRVIGVHEVTQEMASDTGMPEMAGYGFQEEVEQCEYCGRPIAAIRALKEKP